MASRTYRTRAVVLRSLRFGEADRILHLFTEERGRVGAIAKGARRMRSRFGARLEPFAEVDLHLHEGRGELATVTQADLVRSHQALGSDPYRLAVGSIGIEAVLRLFIEHDANPRVYHATCRFLDVVERDGTRAGDAVHDPLVLSFQLKLLWLAGYLPHLASCSGCGGDGPFAAFSPVAGGAVCDACRSGSMAISADGFEGMTALLERPLAEARDAGVTARGARDTLRVVEGLYEHHGGFRLRTLAAR